MIGINLIESMASIHPTGRKHQINIYVKKEVSFQANDLCQGANNSLYSHCIVNTLGENIRSHIFLINLTDLLISPSAHQEFL